MERKIYVCNMCGKETKDYKSEATWIHIDSTGLYYKLYHDRKDEAILASCKKIVSSTADSVDFCCLGCLIEWLLYHCADKVYVREDYYKDFVEVPGKQENYFSDCYNAINVYMKTAYDVIMRKRSLLCSVWDKDQSK